MAAIGIVRAEGVKDPEDHIASLCDMMAGLIRGQFSRSFTLAEQASFHKKHLAPWAELFFSDLESAKNAVFYAPVGTIGKAFMDIESKSFDMELSG
jgi:TorA maturation chaperone TorD